MSVVIARKLGAETAGFFFLCLAVITFMQHICRLGMDNVVLRSIATSYSSEEKYQIGKIVNSLAVIIFIVGLLIGLALSGSSYWIANYLFRKPEIYHHLRSFSLAVPFLSVSFLLGYAFQGQLKLIPMIMAQNLVLNILLILSILFFAASDGADVSLYFVACTAVSCIISFIIWKSGELGAGYGHLSSTWTFLKQGTSFFHVVLLQQCMAWFPIILIGVFTTSAEVAIFSSANRIASLAAFLLLSVNTVLGPRFSSMFKQGKLFEIEATLRTYAKTTIVLSLPYILVVLLFPKWVMSLFGPDFVEGSKVLQILCMGQVVNLLTGSVGLLLMMAHQERAWRLIIGFSFLSNIILCVFLIPAYQAEGAAMAASFSLSLQMVIASVVVWRLFGIVSTPLLPTLCKG